MAKLDLANLSLGPLDAEDDTNLREYFIPFGNFNRVINKSLFLVVGPKGTGKSAIKKHLLETRKDANRQVIDLDREFGFSLSDINPSSYIDENKRKMKGYLVVLILNHLAESHPNLLQRHKLRELANDVPWLEKILKPITFKAVVVDYAISGLFPTDKRSNLQRLLSEPVRQAVIDTLGDEDIWILVDDIDTLFTGGSEDERLELIMGTISAASDLSLQMFAKRVWIVLFLRSERFEDLRRKATELDKELLYLWKIAWSREALTRFLAERIRWVTNTPKGQPEDWYYQLLFAVDNRAAVIEELQTYLFKRVINGPRDLLLLVDMARQTAAEEGAERIALSHIQESEFEYGQRKLGQINANFKHIYPDVDRVVERLFRNSRQTFNRTDLGNHINNKLLTDPMARADFKELGWIGPLNRFLFIQLLYQIGVIGYFNQSEKRYIYVLEEANGEKHWTTNTAFMIHNAFASYLELVA